VALAAADEDVVDTVGAALRADPAWAVEAIDAVPAPPLPMSSATFIWGSDGRPDWGAMWSGFCELALYGGPPHRGDADALHTTADDAPPPADFDAIAEIRRGIFETTGLFSERAADGWLAVSCTSTKMAAWLCASIILENVDARCDGERLLVPASPSFTLRNEVKSVITVVAKTNHYWQAHIASAQAVVLPR
jgi:hypothetical protein